MINDQSRLQYLLSKYAANNCTRQELIEFFTIVQKAGDDASLNDSLEPIWQKISADDKIPDIDKNKIYEQITGGSPVRRLRLLRQLVKYTAAAIILFVVSFGLYQLKHRNVSALKASIATNNVKKVDYNKAILTLDNGSQVALTSKRAGVIAIQNHVPVKQLANGEIAYDGNASEKESSQAFNVLSTPVGAQYALTLTDGTKVWLNAMSSLKYPVAFTGNERRVELSGEGYFEVAKNKSKPFIVTVNNNEVKVYGTHFNIMGYTGEDNTDVTLLEGSVKVTNDNYSKMLLPGQHAAIKDNAILISAAEGYQAIAWKSGNFNFAHEHIDVIMRKLSRWFDIDVTYQGKITREGFVGTIPQAKNLTEVLKTLELTGLVHFKVDGRSVTVMP